MPERIDASAITLFPVLETYFIAVRRQTHFLPLCPSRLLMVLQNHASQSLEHLIHILTCFGADFDQPEPSFLAQGHNLGHLYLPLADEVALGGHYQLLSLVFAVLGDVLQPVLKVMEGGRFGHIEGDDESLGPPVVGPGDSVEAFLAGSIPYLEFDPSLAEGCDFFAEVDADGGDIGFREVVVDVFANE